MSLCTKLVFVNSTLRKLVFQYIHISAWLQYLKFKSPVGNKSCLVIVAYILRFSYKIIIILFSFSHICI